MKNVVFINIVLDGFNQWDGWESLGLEYLSTMLRLHSIDTDIYTVNAEQMDECIQNIIKKSPLIVGFTMPCFYEKKLSYLGSTIKKLLPSVHIVVGNRYATDNAVELLQNYGWIDSVVRGEGEITILELYERLKKGGNLKDCEGIYYKDEKGVIVKNPDRPLINNLDSLPLIHRDMIISKNINHAWVSTSRGCINNCSFCNSKCNNIQKGKILRLRSPENVIQELEYLYRDLHCDNITFVDCSYEDPGEIGKERIKRIAELIIDRNLKISYGVYFSAHNWTKSDVPLLKLLHASGLNYVYVGIESGYEPTLHLFHKKANVENNEKIIKLCNIADLALKYGFIMYHPYLTIEEFKINNEFLYRNGLGYTLGSYYNELYIYKRTDIYNKANADNLLNGKLEPELGSLGWEFKSPQAKQLYYYYTELAKSVTVKKLKSSEWVYKITDIPYAFRKEDMTDSQQKIHNTFIKQLNEFKEKLNYLNYELANNMINVVNTTNKAYFIQIQTMYENEGNRLINACEKHIIHYIYAMKK